MPDTQNITGVLAGVQITMLVLGFVMFALDQSFSRILPWLLPLTYGIVIGLGVALLLGKNPFARRAAAHSPTLANPYASAFVYGGLLAPMTLPCTGPVIVSAFVLGVGSATALGESCSISSPSVSASAGRSSCCRSSRCQCNLGSPGGWSGTPRRLAGLPVRSC